MGLFDFLGFSHPATTEASVVVCDLAAFQCAHGFLAALQQRFNNVLIAFVDEMPAQANYPVVQLSTEILTAQQKLKKMKPQRLIILNLSAQFSPLLTAVTCPIFWINAQEAEIAQLNCKLITTAMPIAALPHASVTGDPLSQLTELPSTNIDTSICERFKEQHEGKRWLAYFAGTGESEESIAYTLFNRAIRYQMGLMLLAPFDHARCEPVYRESIKYRLQTIRHNRLSTSFVPIKTRVYYIEDPEPFKKFYACVDLVILGGSLHADAQHLPDLITPMLFEKPIVVGTAQRNYPLLAAAIHANVIRHAKNEEELFTHMRGLIDDPHSGAQLAAKALEWLTLQPGACARVVALID